VIHEFTNRIEVTTPKGDGVILYMIDYGHESNTIYTVIIDATGEFWQFTHKEIRAKSNITFGRDIKK
tara:strand:+ start:248 stop:448 length:201 start_codon:yes stop_codon:yes gene_type:complete